MLVDGEIQKLIDHYFGGPDLVRAPEHWVGLHVGQDPPNLATGTGFVEPEDESYFRPKADADFWGPAFVAVSGPHAGRIIKGNSGLITFPSPSVTWGVPTHIGLFTQLLGGTPVAVAATQAAQEVEATFIVRFAPGTVNFVGRRL